MTSLPNISQSSSPLPELPPLSEELRDEINDRVVNLANKIFTEDKDITIGTMNKEKRDDLIQLNKNIASIEKEYSVSLRSFKKAIFDFTDILDYRAKNTPGEKLGDQQVDKAILTQALPSLERALKEAPLKPRPLAEQLSDSNRGKLIEERNMYIKSLPFYLDADKNQGERIIQSQPSGTCLITKSPNPRLFFFIYKDNSNKVSYYTFSSAPDEYHFTPMGSYNVMRSSTRNFNPLPDLKKYIEWDGTKLEPIKLDYSNFKEKFPPHILTREQAKELAEKQKDVQFIYSIPGDKFIYHATYSRSENKYHEHKLLGYETIEQIQNSFNRKPLLPSSPEAPPAPRVKP